MDELNRDLADGLLGEDQINQGLSGNLTGAYRDMAAREAISDDGQAQYFRGDQPVRWTMRQRILPSGPLVPRPTLAALLVLALLLILFLAL